MADSEQIDAKAVVKLAIAAWRSQLDESVVREVLGARAVKSLSEVAQAFGVAAATVRHTWRRDGMPGDAKAKRFVLADIFVWLVSRDAANAKARGETEFTKRKQEAETRIAEADARIKERKDKRDEGAFAPVMQVRTEWASYLSVFRDDVMSIADDIKPMFPSAQADQLKDELERRLAKALTALADRPIDGFLERISDHEELHD